jgi:hypothetical protein
MCWITREFMVSKRAEIGAVAQSEIGAISTATSVMCRPTHLQKILGSDHNHNLN